MVTHYLITKIGTIEPFENKYLELYFRLFGPYYRIKRETYNNINSIMDNCISALTNDKAREAVIEALQSGNYDQSDNLSRGFRMLRHPTRSKLLRGPNITYYPQYYGIKKYQEQLRQELSIEFVRYILYSELRNTYIRNILAHNDMQISYQEFTTEMKDNHLAFAECRSIKLLKHGKERVYVFPIAAESRCIDDLFVEIFENDETILCSKSVTPGFKRILLMMGYLFLEDIYDNSEVIKEKLKSADFGQYINEIDILLRNNEINNMEDCFIISPDSEIGEVLNEKKFSNISELLDYFDYEEENDMETETESFINKLHDFFDRLE